MRHSTRESREALELERFTLARRTKPSAWYEDWSDGENEKDNLEQRLSEMESHSPSYRLVAQEFEELFTAPPRHNVLIRREDVMRAFATAINYSDNFASDRRYLAKFEEALDCVVGEQGLNKLGRRRKSRRNPSKLKGKMK